MPKKRQQRRPDQGRRREDHSTRIYAVATRCIARFAGYVQSGVADSTGACDAHDIHPPHGPMLRRAAHTAHLAADVVLGTSSPRAYPTPPSEALLAVARQDPGIDQGAARLLVRLALAASSRSRSGRAGGRHHDADSTTTPTATLVQQAQSLPALVARAAETLANATTAAEVLEAGRDGIVRLRRGEAAGAVCQGEEGARRR